MNNTSNILDSIASEFQFFKEECSYSYQEFNLRFPACVINTTWMGPTTVEMSDKYLHLIIESSPEGTSIKSYYISIPWEKLLRPRECFLKRLIAGICLQTVDSKYIIRLRLPGKMERFVCNHSRPVVSL